MSKTRTIKFLVTEEQYEKLRQDVVVKGHLTIASYLRELCFSKAFAQEEMIFRIYKRVMQDGKD